MSFIKPKKEGMAWEEWCEERERRREVRERRREEVDKTEETKVQFVFRVLTVGVSVPISTFHSILFLMIIHLMSLMSSYFFLSECCRIKLSGVFYLRLQCVGSKTPESE